MTPRKFAALLLATLIGSGWGAWLALRLPPHTVRFIDKETLLPLGEWRYTGDMHHAFILWCEFNQYNPETLAPAVWAVTEE